MVRTRCFSNIPRFQNRVLVDNSFKYNNTTVINFGSGFGGFGCFGGYSVPKYNGWNFAADLCAGIMQGIGMAGLYRNFNCGWGGGTGGNQKTSTTQASSTEKIDDKDQADLQECEKELAKLEGDPTITNDNKDKIKTLYKKVKAGSEGTLKDDIYSLTNQAHYKRMLAALEKLYTFDQDGNPTKKTTSTTQQPPAQQPPAQQPPVQQPPVQQPPVQQTPNPDGLNLDDVDTIPGLTDAEKTELKNLGVKVVEPYSGKAKALTLPNDISKLTKANLEKIAKIAKDHNLKVAVAYNSKIDGDKWIAGDIENIKEDGGKLTYDVNCKNYGTLGLTYSVSKNASGYNVKYKSGTIPTGYTAEADGADYQYSANLLRRNSKKGLVHHT